MAQAIGKHTYRETVCLSLVSSFELFPTKMFYQPLLNKTDKLYHFDYFEFAVPF